MQQLLVLLIFDTLSKMGDRQYDVSAEQKEILLERARRRTALRNEFQKQIWDPHRHASLEGGTVVSSIKITISDI